VRLDPPVVDQPGQVLGRAVGAVGGKPRRVEIEVILNPLDHGACRPNVGLPDGPARLDVDDDGVIEIDQVVGGLGEQGVSLYGSCPLRRRIGPGHELRLDLARCPPGGIIERVEIFLYRPPGLGHGFPVDGLRPFRRALPVGVGPDQAGIDGEALTANQSFFDAAPHCRLEQLTKEIAVPETPVAVLGEARVIRNVALSSPRRQNQR